MAIEVGDEFGEEVVLFGDIFGGSACVRHDCELRKLYVGDLKKLEDLVVAGVLSKIFVCAGQKAEVGRTSILGLAAFSWILAALRGGPRESSRVNYTTPKKSPLYTLQVSCFQSQFQSFLLLNVLTELHLT